MVTMAMANGMDAAIMDPTDKQMMATIYAAQALLAKDDYCMEYIRASRAGKLDV
jgi:5-methyltetrahydrofolate--homocysteine methyltransferase